MQVVCAQHVYVVRIIPRIELLVRAKASQLTRKLLVAAEDFVLPPFHQIAGHISGLADAAGTKLSKIVLGCVVVVVADAFADVVAVDVSVVFVLDVTLQQRMFVLILMLPARRSTCCGPLLLPSMGGVALR